MRYGVDLSGPGGGPHRHLGQRHDGPGGEDGRVGHGGIQVADTEGGAHRLGGDPGGLVVDALGDDDGMAAFGVRGQRVGEVRGVGVGLRREQFGTGDDDVGFDEGEQRGRVLAADEPVDADDLAGRPGAGDAGECPLRAAFDGVGEDDHDVTFEASRRLVVEVVDQVEIEGDQQRQDLGQRLRTLGRGHLALPLVEHRVFFDETGGAFEGGGGGEPGAGRPPELQFDGGESAIGQPADRRELHVELQIIEQGE